MGLDMYLMRKVQVSQSKMYKPEYRMSIDVRLAGKRHPYIDHKKVNYLELEAIYWRKANHIHKWFVDNCQNGQDDCKDYPISIEQLKILRDLSQSVLDNHKNASSILPTQSGFFFGGTEYDEYYYKDLEHTVKEIDNILIIPEEHQGDFYYYSSW